MAKLYNLARMSTTTTGTGTITLGSAIGGYLTFAQAGVANGETIAYAIKDGANSEIGTGVYTSSGTTLTRSVTKSTNSDTAINLSGVAEVFITPRKEDLLSVSETQSANQVYAGPSSGGATAPGFRALVAADIPVNAGVFIERDTYTTSQTVTIPTGATRAKVRLVGASGGVKVTGGSCLDGISASGAGGYLEKYLTGLVGGKTLTLAIGAAGASTPTSGGSSSLGTGPAGNPQTITTLTANGSGSASGSDVATVSAGGAATNGDLNLPGGSGYGTRTANALGGSNPLGFGAVQINQGATAGQNYGGGAAARGLTATQSAAGAQGVCIIDWYA
jgi:hypothetical protein